MTTHEDGLREALTKLIAACDAGRRFERGAGGMTIDAQIRRTEINGVSAYVVEEAREALMGLTDLMSNAPALPALSASPKPAESEESEIDAIVEKATSGFRDDVQRIMATAPQPDADAAELVIRLRKKAKDASEISRHMAEAKSLRQPGNSEGRTDLYMWQAPEQTIEWRAADLIEELATPKQKEASTDLAEALEVMREIRAKASGREPLPLPSGTKESHRNVALENLAILGGIERLSAAFVEKHRGGGK